ncbi:MAG: CPBP family intramembrane metalloprotease [Armatimonadetes bacterium]|nr:CPBP family intramembrane metalloprotease [Armatimonadota bacterium]
MGPQILIFPLVLSLMLVGLACALLLYYAAEELKLSPWAWALVGFVFGFLGLGVFLLATWKRTPPADLSELPVVEEKGPPPATPTARQAVILFLFVMATMVTSTVTAYRLGGVSTVAGGEIFGILLPTLIYARYLRLDWRSLFRWRPISWLTALLALVAGLSLTVLGSTLLAFSSRLGLAPHWLNLPGQTSVESGLSRWVLCASIVLLPMIAEEWLFRGFLLRAFAPKGRRVAILVTAVLFASFHFEPVRFLDTLLVGVIAALLVEWTDSTFTSSLLHGAVNFVAATLLMKFNRTCMCGSDASPALPSVAMIMGATAVEALCLWGLWWLHRGRLIGSAPPLPQQGEGEQPMMGIAGC